MVALPHKCGVQCGLFQKGLKNNNINYNSGKNTI